MIGETAYERKHGGRRLGVIVGQRTASDAKGRPVEQWEIRSSRGVKFFMAKAEVRLVSEPEPEPEPEMPPGLVEVARGGEETIEQQRRPRRSAAPVTITLIGVALVVVGIVLLATGLGAKLSASRGYAIALAPLLLGLIVILVGTNLIGEQSRRPARLRPKLEEEPHTRAPEETK